jgi:hypothetical protein
MKPEVNKIFDDLDKLLDFCRFELLPFNPADLYNRNSRVWQAFENSQRPRAHWKTNNNNNNRKFDNNRPRSNNNYRGPRA